MRARRIACGALVACAAGCSLLTDVDGFTDGSPTSPIEGGLPETAAPPPGDARTDGMDGSFDAAPPGPPVWRLASSSGPSQRHSSAIEADETRGRMMLFGGNTDSGQEIVDAKGIVLARTSDRAMAEHIRTLLVVWETLKKKQAGSSPVSLPEQK